MLREYMEMYTILLSEIMPLACQRLNICLKVDNW